MYVERVGSSHSLDSLCNRLQKQCLVKTMPFRQDFGDDEFVGLYYQGVAIEINHGLHWRAQQRAKLFVEHSYVELSYLAGSCAEQCGFYLFVGGANRAKEIIQPILNILAPTKGAWLNCGEIGAASFSAAVFNALNFPLNNLAINIEDFTNKILELCFAKYYKLLRNLFNLANDYLNSQKKLAQNINKKPVGFSLNNFALNLALYLQQFLAPLMQRFNLLENTQFV